MTAVYIALIVISAGLCFWWVRHRSARLRSEAESREAQMLEALFAARRSAAGNGGETIDLDKVFGGKAATDSPTSTDAVLRAAGLDAELISLVKSPPRTNAAPSGAEASAASGAGDRGKAHSLSAMFNADENDDSPQDGAISAPAADEPAQVRDLVQIFYEARGYRVVPAGRAARPIELVLRHKSDPLRSYAFAPLAEAVSEATARTLLEQARRIDQSRVLIATESGMAPELADSLLAQGIRVLDSAAIEAQLAKLDFATSAKIRAVARRRAAQRARSMPG